MKNFRVVMVAMMSLLMLNVSAQIPQGYYESAEGKKDAALLEALFNTIKDHHVISYNSLEPYYERTDYAGDSILDMYSTCHFTMDYANRQQKAVCDGWNKEHSIPQSWFNEASPMKSDLFHVYPTDARVNNFRSNYPYGEVNGGNGTGFKDNYGNHGLGKLGENTFSGYSGKVFEPADQYKGDFARTYFYMVARYRDRALDKSNGSVVFTSSPTNLTTFAKNLFLKWHRQDPVSEKEIARNDSVFAIQNNRNPFIDYPYLVEYIWGSKTGVAADFTQMISSSDPEFIPGESDGYHEASDPLLICATTSIAFPTLRDGEAAEQKLQFQGVRLKDDVIISISGANADCFSATPDYIDIEDMQASNKQDITVTYKPTSNAVHSAVLTIASEGANTIEVALSGACAVECEIIWIANCEEYEEGNPTLSVAIGNKVTELPTPPTACSETSTQFVGWSQKQITTPTDEVPDDLFSDASESPVINGNTTFYAVFARLTQKGSDTPKELTWTPEGQEAGWTADGIKKSGNVYVFITGASLISPEIDLTTLEKVVVKIRSYGGTSYNTLEIRAGEDLLGKVEADGSTYTERTWTNDLDLGGISALTFTSPTTTTKNGPGVAQITIYSAGLQYIYDQFTTSCPGKCGDEPVNPEQGLEEVTAPHKAQMFIHNGQLYILSGDHIYNIMGQQLQ